MNEMATRDVSKLKDIDEMSISAEDFKERYGYAPLGRLSIKTQIVIGSRSFSTIAMTGVQGLEVWDWFEGTTIDSEKFATFVRTKCQSVLRPGEFGVIDNASIHRKTVSREAMEEAFNSDWTYSSPYTPQLKPIEKVFALIKRFLRENENAALLDPEEWLEKAFTRYSTHGSHGHVVRSFFNVYYRNRLSYLNAL